MDFRRLRRTFEKIEERAEARSIEAEYQITKDEGALPAPKGETMTTSELSQKFTAIIDSVPKRLTEDKKRESEEELWRVIRSGYRKPHDFLRLFRKAEVPRVIAEVKMASPSEGDIAPELDPVAVATDYLENGAAALSVLTEPYFFKGNKVFVQRIRLKHPDALILWKDFVLEPYQVLQAQVYGADAVLLIVAALDAESLAKLYALAVKVGLTPLVEVHDAVEMAVALEVGAKFIGVNNRNLKTMQVDIATSSQKLARMAKGRLLISESGIKEATDLIALRLNGYEGFLIGTEFMRTGKPGVALRKMRGAVNAVWE